MSAGASGGLDKSSRRWVAARGPDQHGGMASSEDTDRAVEIIREASILAFGPEIPPETTHCPSEARTRVLPLG